MKVFCHEKKNHSIFLIEFKVKHKTLKPYFIYMYLLQNFVCHAMKWLQHIVLHISIVYNTFSFQDFLKLWLKVEYDIWYTLYITLVLFKL